MTVNSLEHAMAAGDVSTTNNACFPLLVRGAPGRRYCPLCLREDKAPYFRLIWRLSVAPVCIKHKVFLVSECGHCKLRLYPFEKARVLDIAKCNYCGSLLSSATADAVNPRERGFVIVSNILKLIEGTLDIGQIGWKGTLPELFVGLEFFIRLKAMTSRYTEDLRSVSTVYELLEHAWVLLLDPTSRSQFIRQHQTIFNRLTARGCPDFLVKYIVRKEIRKMNCSSVRKKMSQLANAGELTIVRLASETGNSPERLRTHSQAIGLTQALRISKRKRKINQINDVRRVIAEFRAKQKYPLLGEVAHRSHVPLSNFRVSSHAYLRKMVISAQLAFLKTSPHAQNRRCAREIYLWKISNR